MSYFILLRAFVLILSVTVFAYVLVKIFQRVRNRGANTGQVDFRPTIGFTRLDGWSSLAVLLENRHDENVWAEEIEIVLNELKATDQTSEAGLREVQKIRQNVQPDDMLPVSLVESIYKAAGKPQRKYTCVMSAIVRYRAGDEWFEKPLQPYRLRMAGLTVVDNRRERWIMSEFKPQEKSQVPETVGTKSK